MGSRRPKENSWLREAHTGLCPRVRSGRWGERREYFVCYRWNRKPRYVALGLVDQIALEEAREESIAIRSKVAKAQRLGEPNPLDVVSEAGYFTMGQLSQRYQDLIEKSPLAKKNDQGRWENHILPFRSSDRRKPLRETWIH